MSTRPPAAIASDTWRSVVARKSSRAWGPSLGVRQERISDLQRGGLLHKCLDESIGDRLRNQKALGRNTTLCVVGVARSHAQLHRFRDIRIFQHDKRVGAAEFQHHLLALQTRLLRHRPARRTLPVTVTARIRASAIMAGTAPR